MDADGTMVVLCVINSKGAVLDKSLCVLRLEWGNQISLDVWRFFLRRHAL